MSKLGGGGIIIIGILIALFGVLLLTRIGDLLVDFTGFILLAIGVITVVIGVMSRGNRNSF